MADILISCELVKVKVTCLKGQGHIGHYQWIPHLPINTFQKSSEVL